jgi:hypothetical protein
VYIHTHLCGRSPAAIVGSNPTGGMDVCLSCVLSGRGLCDELITRTEESYRLWSVVDQETSWTRRPYPALGYRARENNNNNNNNNNNTHLTAYRLYINYRCYQITLHRNIFTQIGSRAKC